MKLWDDGLTVYEVAKHYANQVSDKVSVIDVIAAAIACERARINEI